MRRIALVLAASAVGLAAMPAQSAPAVTAMPLEAPRPDWYTDELHARVIAAGARGVPLPEGAEVPASGLAFTGIRPGSWMISPAGCTMNFIFGTPATADTSTRKRAKRSNGYSIGTAGHCTEQVGEEVVLVAIGPASPTPLLVHVGNTIRTTGDAGIGNDFALVSIRPELQSWVSPAMAHWGGPTGAYTGTAPMPMVHSGHGLVIGTGGTPRAAQGLYVERDAVYWVGATIFGDSGSAINTATGLAQANITHLVVDTRRLGANSAGTHISKILQIAGEPLATCPTAVPWPLPGCAPV